MVSCAGLSRGGVDLSHHRASDAEDSQALAAQLAPVGKGVKAFCMEAFDSVRWEGRQAAVRLLRSAAVLVYYPHAPPGAKARDVDWRPRKS
jgi:hypothetical protein